jgi:MoaA/NifB/PqqE/SkfB family radical SAM enzyme
MSESQDFSQIVKEYRNREVNVKSKPAVIFLESVRGCPFTCAMCKSRPTKVRRISQELLKCIEPYFPDVEVLQFSGFGEPLLADLDYLVQQSVEHDFVLHTDTNGFLLTDEMSDLLLKTRLSIRFSFHAGRAETYYRIMGINMDKAIDKIKHLVEKSKNSPKNHDFWFSYCVMKENVHEIEDFFRLTHECGIRSVRLMRLLPTLKIIKGVTVRGLKFKYLEQTGKHVDRVFFANLPRYKELAAELGIKLEWGDKLNENAHFTKTLGELANSFSNKFLSRQIFPLVPAKGAHCAAPWIGQLVISVDGDVQLCCASQYPLGNLNQSSIDEIWHGPKMTKIRETFHNGRYPRLCGYCRGFGFEDYPNNSFPGIRSR